MEALSVIWAPVSVLARIAEERRVMLGFVVVALYGALSLVTAAIAVLGGLYAGQLTPQIIRDLSPEFYENAPRLISVALLVLAIANPFLWWLAISALMQLVTRFFGGTGAFSAMFAIVGVANVPFVIQAALQLSLIALQIAIGPESVATYIIGTLTTLLGLAFLVWHVVLVVIGAAFARRIGYGQSAGSCAISCAGCAGLILIVAVVFGILIAVFVGALGSAGPS